MPTDMRARRRCDLSVNEGLFSSEGGYVSIFFADEAMNEAPQRLDPASGVGPTNS